MIVGTILVVRGRVVGDVRLLTFELKTEQPEYLIPQIIKHTLKAVKRIKYTVHEKNRKNLSRSQDSKIV